MIGPCRGDSGGPLMVKDLDTLQWVQVATVQGSFGQCGDINVPGIMLQKKLIKMSHRKNYLLNNVKKFFTLNDINFLLKHC